MSKISNTKYNCPECKTIFEPKISQTYCTEKCRKKAERRRWEKRWRKKTSSARIERYEAALTFARSKESLQLRLEARMIPEPNSGCWLWLGALDGSGYGVIGHGERTLRVSKAAYEVFIGEATQGLLVLHTCDQPSCFNPNHLYAGTAKDNADDRVRRGRWSPVRDNGRFTKA